MRLFPRQIIDGGPALQLVSEQEVSRTPDGEAAANDVVQEDICDPRWRWSMHAGREWSPDRKSDLTREDDSSSSNRNHGTKTRTSARIAN